MRELVLRVPRRAVEDVLDRLLPIVPQGVREVPVGRHVELLVRGPELPSEPDLKRAAGRWPHKLSEREVPDDWRQRRVLDYQPDVIGGRLVVRPNWAPPTGAEIEIVLADTSAFGVGTHPTTRTCLELLLALPVLGSFADLGCGTGVLAIAAARLGWSPVAAVDHNRQSVAAASANARANHVELDAHVADLSATPPPHVDCMAANVPPELHALIAPGLTERLPRMALLSGFETDRAVEVSAAYRSRGLRERERDDRHGWSVLVLERD
jgi:ribosomal protein L11 methyltransferase